MIRYRRRCGETRLSLSRVLCLFRQIFNILAVSESLTEMEFAKDIIEELLEVVGATCDRVLESEDQVGHNIS